MKAPTNTPATPPNFPEALIAFSKMQAVENNQNNFKNNSQQPSTDRSQVIRSWLCWSEVLSWKAFRFLERDMYVIMYDSVVL